MRIAHKGKPKATAITPTRKPTIIAPHIISAKLIACPQSQVFFQKKPAESYLGAYENPGGVAATPHSAGKSFIPLPAP